MELSAVRFRLFLFQKGKLSFAGTPADILVVDRVERPSEN